jgi:hypothetical protein
MRRQLCDQHVASENQAGRLEDAMLRRLAKRSLTRIPTESHSSTSTRPSLSVLNQPALTRSERWGTRPPKEYNCSFGPLRPAVPGRTVNFPYFTTTVPTMCECTEQKYL